MGGVGKNHARGDSPDVVTVSPERSVTSYRIDPLIARSFKESCSKAGQSTCSVLEAFMFGFSRAVIAGDTRPAPQITVNLHMERIVQRVHRRGHEILYTEEREIQGDREHCAWCGRTPVAEVGIRRSLDRWIQPYLCELCLGYVKKRGIYHWSRELYPKF